VFSYFCGLLRPACVNLFLGEQQKAGNFESASVANEKQTL